MITKSTKKLKAIGAFRRFQKDGDFQYRNRRDSSDDKNRLYRNRTGKVRRKDKKPSQCINLKKK